MSSATNASIRFESPDFGETVVERLDLEIAAEVTSLSGAEAERRVREYRLSEMAEAWSAAAPTSEEAMRKFYASNDHYIWELLQWNGSAMWEEYRQKLRDLGSTLAGKGASEILDYGSGIGSAALALASANTRVTLADVPGTTLAFAAERLRRRQYEVETIEIRSEVAALDPRRYSVVVCLDVLEHVKNPDRVLKALVRGVRPEGLIYVVAKFYEQGEQYPHHLEPTKYADYRWELFVRGCGLRPWQTDVYQRESSIARLLSRAQYEVWQKTGLMVQRLPR